MKKLGIVCLALMTLTVPTRAVNTSNSWDVLEDRVARSPLSISLALDSGTNTGMSIYVASPTHKFNYCSAAIMAVVDEERADINRAHKLVAKWIGRKESPLTSSYSFLISPKNAMVKNPSGFIKNLKAYHEVELTYHLVGGTVVKNRVSLKGSSKAIGKVCLGLPSKSSVKTSLFSVEEQIQAEIDRRLETGSSCGSKLYYRLVGNSLYVGIRGIERDQEILQPANSPHWQTIRVVLDTPALYSDRQILRAGRPWYLHDALCD